MERGAGTFSKKRKKKEGLGLGAGDGEHVAFLNKNIIPRRGLNLSMVRVASGVSLSMDGYII
jgi:hypothetical protein